jgi:hypothetical protein
LDHLKLRRTPHSGNARQCQGEDDEHETNSGNETLEDDGYWDEEDELQEEWEGQREESEDKDDGRGAQSTLYILTVKLVIGFEDACK